MLGFFDDKNREYVIKNMFPRRPLINYLWNEKTVCTCNQFGEGFCWGLPDTNRRMIDKYPQFGDMLSSYLDVDLIEQIESMAQTRQFDLSGFDFEPYKRFDEATHKKLELILK